MLLQSTPSLRKRDRKPVTSICEKCGQPFQRKFSETDRRFCSRTCYEDTRKNATLSCIECGQPFTSSKSNTKCCSAACRLRHSEFVRDGIPTERFWSLVDKTTSPFGCWFWTGHLNNGYGVLHPKGRSVMASRFLWELVKGPIPDGLLLCHTCDVFWPVDDISYRRCINLDHLFPGTRGENCTDCRLKGRTARGARSGRQTHPESTLRGEAHHKAKLTEADVMEIRAICPPNSLPKELPERYHVSGNTIRRVVQRQSWKHLL